MLKADLTLPGSRPSVLGPRSSVCSQTRTLRTRPLSYEELPKCLLGEEREPLGAMGTVQGPLLWSWARPERRGSALCLV